MTRRDVIEAAGIVGTPESLEEDRRRIRDELAALTTADGLPGENQRMPDG